MKRTQNKSRANGQGHSPRRWPWGLGATVMFLVPWLLLVPFVLQSVSQNDWPNLKQLFSAPAKHWHAQPGPWGQLTCEDVELSAPERCDASLCPTNQPRWFFRESSTEEIAAFFRSAGCADPQVADLLQTAVSQTNGWLILPKADLVYGLSAQTRARIYAHLAQFLSNPGQAFAYRWTRREFNHWLGASGFAPATKKMIEHLLYSDGEHVFFADEWLLFQRMAKDAEKIKVLENFLRVKAVIVILHVDHEANVAELADYWGAGGRTRELLPILRGLADRPEGGDIGLSKLLPPFARSRLYTYPFMQGRSDCNWTTLNFFSSTPSEAFTGPQLREIFDHQFVEIDATKARLGDMVLFRNRSGDIVHSVVYIADDIVFSKNGISPKKPWVLTTLAEVRNVFWNMPDVGFFRKKS